MQRLYNKEFLIDSEDTSAFLPELREAVRKIDANNDSLTLAIVEAVANCLKHSHGKRAKVEIVEDDGNYEVTVVDDGVGYDYQSHLENIKQGFVPDATASSGRGIFIIYTLCQGKLRISDNGKRIDFCLSAA